MLITRENFLHLIILADNSGLLVMSTKLQMMETEITQPIEGTRSIFRHDTDITGISGRLIGSQLTWRKLIAKAALFSCSEIQWHLGRRSQPAQEQNTNSSVTYWHKCQCLFLK